MNTLTQQIKSIQQNKHRAEQLIQIAQEDYQEDIKRINKNTQEIVDKYKDVACKIVRDMNEDMNMYTLDVTYHETGLNVTSLYRNTRYIVEWQQIEQYLNDNKQNIINIIKDVNKQVNEIVSKYENQRSALRLAEANEFHNAQAPIANLYDIYIDTACKVLKEYHGLQPNESSLALQNPKSKYSNITEEGVYIFAQPYATPKLIKWDDILNYQNKNNEK